ncbi:hypothetical protein ACTRXD_11770 [Nitrospira sp. T9]|uniref:hypothetical protein n=1 Tax=unclassified Nitrospira TaxID=2652172 RepID=UPI003F969680
MPQKPLSNREIFRDGALWLIIPGLLEEVAAAMAGDWAVEAAEKPGIPESMIGTHETLAFATLGFWAVLL